MTASPIVLALITVNVIFSLLGFRDPYFFNRLKFNVAQITAGQWQRLLTSSVLHVNMQHLLFNMFTLFFFGDVVLGGLGVVGFLTLYIGSVLGGGLFALRYHRNTPHYSAVGASGGVVGVLFAAIVLFPQMRLALLFFPVPIPGYIFALVYLGYTLYGMRKQNDQIGHTAHLGGALTGVILVLLWQLL